MASDQQFCLRWNNHQSTLVSVFDNLLESQTLVDCTLAADGQYLKAHKVVLSACSPYLEAILCQNLDKHPILILKDVKFSELKAMLDYMYRGEVNISQEQLSTFLKAAESLQIKGLTDSGGGGNSDRDRDRDREPLKRQDLRKPLNQPVPHIPQPRPVVPHPGLMERRSLPHFPPHIADMQPQSPRHAREGSTSPTARKRRRPNRPSSDDSNFVSTPNSLSENQPDTSDSCDVPVKQAASSTPNVPNATTKAPETDSNRTTPQPQNNQLNSEQKQQQVTVKKEFSEALLTPKTEFDYGNDNSMEDVTYEDDEEEEVDLSKPGTSFAANSQGFPPWQMGGDGSNDDSNNMYSPDVTAATNQNNSQDCEIINSKNIGKKRQNAPLSKKEDRRSTSQRKDKFEDRQYHYKDGFTKQIFQFASELSSIVSITKKSFSNPTSTDGDVVDVDSDSDVEFLPDCESRDSCPAAESAPGNLVFQSVEDNAIATMNPTNVEPDIDPLSLPHEVFIKTEPLPVVIKSENIHSFLADQEANQASLQQEKVVPLFQCDYCPYTSKHRNVIGNHKWREHKDEWFKKSGGKSNLPKAAKKHDRLFKCNYCSFTSPHKNVLGSHKFRAHSVRGRSKKWFDKVLNVRSLRPATKSVELDQRVEGIKNEIKYEVKEEQTSQLSPLSFGSPAAKKCSHCSFLTKSSSALVMHKKLKHFIQPPKDVSAGEKIVIPLIKKCPLCPFKSRFPAAMGSHKSKKHFIPSGRNGDEAKQIVVPLTQKCSLCPFKSRFPGAMASHKSRKHFIQPGKNDDEDEKIVVPSMKKCSHCSFETRHNYALAAHKKHVHSIMPERQGNKVNKIRVSVIKKCNLCPFKTKFNAALAMHKKTKHFIQPPKKLKREGRFECEHCHSSYSNLGNLQRHLKSHHGDGGVARKKCPHCGVMKVTQFQLRRHIENKHPEHWGEMINQKPVSSVEGEHLTETKEAVKHLVQRKTPNSNEPCRSKLSCQSCHFQTEDSHILGLHKQKQHFQKKSDGQGGLMKCLFCSEVCQIKSLLMKHVKSKHPGAWLKMERSAAQSKLRYESGGEETVTKKISKLTNESNKEASSTADRFNETNNSNSSWKDINTEEDGKTQGAKKTFCEICDRFYNATYYRYHTCKNKIECDLCSYKTFSIYNMSVHKTKTHRSQVLLKSEKSGEIKSQENKRNVAKEISQSQDYSEEDTKFETASTEQSSVSELNDDEEYVPSKTSKKVTKFVGARKKCNKCKKSFHLGYIKLHRCAKGLKCSSCSYTDTSSVKLKLHERFHHSNLETETDESATNEEPMSVDNQLSDIEPKTEMKLENDLESTCGTEGQHLLPTTETEDTVLENKWQCDMCSFESSTEAFMVRHKLKQHPVKKSAAGNVQNRRKLKCEFCTLVFNNTNQLKNHLNRKHKEEQEKTLSQDLKRVKLSKQSDSAMEAVTSDEDRPDGPEDRPEDSGDTVEEIELPSSDNGNTQPPCESVIEGTQPLSDNAVQEQHSEPTETLANANVEESSPPSDIVEGSSNVNVEESSQPSDIIEGSSNVQEDRVKCENCKMYFKTSTFKGHYCRPVLRCQECTFITRIKLQMRLHKRDHLKDDCVLTEESLYQCRICQKKFASKSWFRHHKINECQKKSFHQCSICQKKFHQEKNLELHVLQIHRDKNDEGKEGKDKEKDEGKDDDKSKYPCITV